MPPIPTWFRGRDTVLALIDSRLLPGEGRRLLVPTMANGRPAFAVYTRAGERLEARYLQVLTVAEGAVAAVLAFHRTSLFPAFGLPMDRPVR